MISLSQPAPEPLLIARNARDDPKLEVSLFFDDDVNPAYRWFCPSSYILRHRYVVTVIDPRSGDSAPPPASLCRMETWCCLVYRG